MTDKDQNEIRFSLRILNPAVHKQAVKMADAEDRSLNWLINRALEQYVQNGKGGHGA